LKAILTTDYGRPLDVLQLRQVATPEPSEAEVLVRLFASSVNPLDDFSIRGPLFFVPKLGRLLQPTHKIQKFASSNDLLPASRARILSTIESLPEQHEPFRHPLYWAPFVIFTG
jgi:hypothetical protein